MSTIPGFITIIIYMHFVVFGVGAIGGFYGTKLARFVAGSDEHRLSFIARGRTYDVLKSQGAKLISKKVVEGKAMSSTSFAEMEETTIIESNLKVYEKYSDLDIKADEYTVVLLCVKSKDTISACEDIKTQLTENTVVVSVQNGVENEERIADVLGQEHVMGSLTTVAAETLEPGIYIQKGHYGLLLGELEENKEISWDDKLRIEKICDALKGADIRTKTTENIYKDLWSKLVWNASFNPMSVMHEKTIGPLLDDADIKNQIIGIMQEVKQVAAALGYQLADDVVTKHIERTSTPEWYDFRTSMLQDYQKGKAIELYELLGVVVRKGKGLGIETPFAISLYNNLKEKLNIIGARG